MASEDGAENSSMRYVNKIFRETLGLEIAKRIVGTSIRLWK
jgi:hypothetical protein